MLPGTVRLVRWLKASGDKVQIGEMICEIEVGDISAGVPASRTGILYHGVETGAEIKSANGLAKIVGEE